MEAARLKFAERGFEGATIRSIAQEAKVDGALVHHFFQSKEGVFQAAIEEALKPDEFIPPVVEPGIEGLGERLVRMFFSLWDTEATRNPMLAILRSAVTHEEATRLLREFISTYVLGRVADAIDMPNPELRATLVGSQLVGMAMVRYVIRIEPVASADIDSLVNWVAPTVQRYLAESQVSDQE